jgi:DNA repair photolyase
MFLLIPYKPPMVDILPDQPRKGRGAVANPSGRFETEKRHNIDDGWGDGGARDRDFAPLRTTVAPDKTKTVIARNSSPDIPFDRSINPYRGCEHGCIYCYARPTHAWLGLSPGLDFESRLFAKRDAAKLLRKELANPRYRCRPIALGTNTDPYQPIERDFKITRAILEVLAEFDHPVTVVTKSALVARDIDILAPLAAKGLAAVCLSVTTLDAALSRRMEPRAASPERRLKTIAALADAAIPVGVMAAPMIPALNDMELENILAAAAAAGARTAGYIVLRMPHEIKDLFTEWLEVHYPAKAKHILGLVRDMRSGALNTSTFHSRMRGSGQYSDLLARRFSLACKRLGLTKKDWSLDTTRFRRPRMEAEQLELL